MAHFWPMRHEGKSARGFMGKVSIVALLMSACAAWSSNGHFSTMRGHQGRTMGKAQVFYDILVLLK